MIRNNFFSLDYFPRFSLHILYHFETILFLSLKTQLMFLGSDFLTQNALKYCVSKRKFLSLSSPMPLEVQKLYNFILFFNIVILGHIENDLNFDIFFIIVVLSIQKKFQYKLGTSEII